MRLAMMFLSRPRICLPALEFASRKPAVLLTAYAPTWETVTTLNFRNRKYSDGRCLTDAYGSATHKSLALIAWSVLIRADLVR